MSPEAMFTVTKNSDGSTTVNVAPTAVNWTALIQAIVAAMPYILAIFSAFAGSSPVPSPPVPPPIPSST